MRVLLMVALLCCATQAALPQNAEKNIDTTQGRLVSARDRSITLRNDHGARTFLITPDTKIWRGDYVDIRQLRPGDDLSVRFRASDHNGQATAVDIAANIDRWDGNVTKVSGNRVEIEFTDRDGHPLGTKGTVTFWNRTTFLVDASLRDMRPGACLSLTGLVESPTTMLAWQVIGFRP